jgi:hypothetical protein
VVRKFCAGDFYANFIKFRCNSKYAFKNTLQ